MSIPTPTPRAKRVNEIFDFSAGRGLEIGPLHQPLVPRDAAEVSYLDLYDRDRLYESYAEHSQVNHDTIPEIDYPMWDGTRMRTLEEAAKEGAPFDWALASHVVEHVPDLVGWLAQVEAVVALAPWLNHKTSVQPVAGRRVLIVHGTEDRWTSPAKSLDYARRAEGVAASVDYVSLKAAGHFMVRRLALWNVLANGYVLDAFGEATGADVSGARDALRGALGSAPPAAGTRMPVVL